MVEQTILNFLEQHSGFFENNENNFSILKIALNKNNDELIEIYKNHIENHNKSMFTDVFPNSGFDLFVPKETIFDKEIVSKFIDLELKAEMLHYSNNIWNTCAYIVHPRSSISKTPLMLANHTGIIDSGYRGSLIGAFRWLKSNDNNQLDYQQSYVVEKHTRLLQICHPSLCRVFVCLVDETELSTTLRGNGGFGSTGIVGV